MTSIVERCRPESKKTTPPEVSTGRADHSTTPVGILGAVGTFERGEDDFRRPPPADDRVWRHPSEVGALIAAAGAAPVITRRPWGVAMFSALGGALAVALAFMAVGGFDPDRVLVREFFAVQSVTTEPRVVSAEEWAATVGEPARPAVARLTVRTADELRAGAGLVLRDDGYMVTSGWLVADAESVAITFDDGTLAPGRVIGVDEVSDLAVIHVAGTAVVAAVQAQSMDLSEGDKVAIVGIDVIAPATVDRVDATIVDRQGRAHHGQAVLEGGSEIAGLSGATLDDSGAVVGFATPVPGSPYATLVVPIEVARSVANQIIEYGEARYDAWLGVDVIGGVSSDGSAPTGIDVQSVVFDGPAFRAGIRAGDVIVAIDGQPISAATSLRELVDEADPDQPMLLSVQRGDQTLEPAVVLGRRPQVDP